MRSSRVLDRSPTGSLDPLRGHGRCGCLRIRILGWRGSTNAELPGRIAEACARSKIRLIHISTDAVFGGEKSGPYAEADRPNPGGVYASTKLEGERQGIGSVPTG